MECRKRRVQAGADWALGTCYDTRSSRVLLLGNANIRVKGQTDRESAIIFLRDHSSVMAQAFLKSIAQKPPRADDDGMRPEWDNTRITMYTGCGGIEATREKLRRPRKI